jgi:hypothetical protein
MYQRAPDTLARRTPRSLVVLARQAEAPIRISGSSVVVWDLLATPRRLWDLVLDVALRVDAPSTEVAVDLEVALEVLIEVGAVVESP